VARGQSSGSARVSARGNPHRGLGVARTRQ
jgi:hypothetical protein